MNKQPTDTQKRDPRALNAYRHGLTGQIRIFTPAERAAFEKHCRGIHESLAPVGAMELELVQSVGDGRWRLKRAAAIEDAIFAMGSTHPDFIKEGEEELDAAVSHAQVWLEQGKNLQLLTLYESRIQRRVEKDLALLRQLQQDRRNRQTPAIQKDSAKTHPPQFDFSTPPAAPGSLSEPPAAAPSGTPNPLAEAA